MKLKIVLLVVLLTLLSACSIFKRDRTGYEDSDSVGDLSVPPELNLPKRDTNYDIPEAEKVAEPEAVEEVKEVAETAVEVEAAVEEVVDKAE